MISCQKVSVIAAHPDDETLGMGGTIRKLSDSGAQVSVLFLSEGVSSRQVYRETADERKSAAARALGILGVSDVSFLNYPDNQFDSVPLLTLVKSVEAFLEEKRPEIVFSNYSTDLNVDHRLTAAATLTSCRPNLIPSIRGLFQFKTVSSTEWNFGEDSFGPNLYVDISNTFRFKLQALAEYEQELNEFPHPRSIAAIEALATLTGSESGFFRAESFVQRYYLG